MAETCIVPNCNSGHEISAERIAFFNIPENGELRNKWIQVIPNSGVALNTTDMVCEKHFIETDVIRHYIVQDAAGKVVEKVAYDYPRLSNTAVPMIFPGLPLQVNEAQVQNTPQSTSQAMNNTFYDYLVIDMATDVAVDAIKSGSSLIGSVVNHTQHKTNEPEVVSHAAGHASENQPLLSTEAIQNNSSSANGNIPTNTANISSPVNGEILSDAAKSSIPVDGNVPNDAANQSTNAVDILSNDVPVTAEPVPIFVQPTSMFALSDRPVADVTDGNDNDCCDCDDGCCDCDDCDCDCDGCVLS